MNAISHRSTKAFGLVGVLAAAMLTGCAATGGATASAAARAPAIEAPALGPRICSGGYASRFPHRQATGRVCRESLSFQSIY